MDTTLWSGFRSTAEQEWLAWLKATPTRDHALQVFTQNYHFFSVGQIIAFSRVFSMIPRRDRESLALLATVLYEEFGCGQVHQVHSVLFERFAAAVGLDPETLFSNEQCVVPGVRGYLQLLDEGFSRSLPTALATYVFLENSAVETYEPLLQCLRSFGFSEHDLEFFAIHSQIEVEHAAAAQMLVQRQALTGTEVSDYQAYLERLSTQWDNFWRDIYVAST